MAISSAKPGLKIQNTNTNTGDMHIHVDIKGFHVKTKLEMPKKYIMSNTNTTLVLVLVKCWWVTYDLFGDKYPRHGNANVSIYLLKSI